jgi:hypothetical protein
LTWSYDSLKNFNKFLGKNLQKEGMKYSFLCKFWDNFFEIVLKQQKILLVAPPHQLLLLSLSQHTPDLFVRMT